MLSKIKAVVQRWVSTVNVQLMCFPAWEGDDCICVFFDGEFKKCFSVVSARMFLLLLSLCGGLQGPTGISYDLGVSVCRCEGI